MTTLKIMLFTLALCQSARAQTWESVETQEGSKLFHLLHGQYIAVDSVQNLGTTPQLPEVSPATPTVSFSPQGATILADLAGKRIKGIGIDALIICSPSGVLVYGGDVYKAASQAGISWISPSLAAPKFRKTAALSVPSLLLSAATYGSLGIPVLGQAGVISMTSRFIVGLLSGHALFDSFKGQIQAQLPDPTPLLASLLDPEGVLAFSGPCHESRMVTVYHKNPVAGTFPIVH